MGGAQTTPFGDPPESTPPEARAFVAKAKAVAMVLGALAGLSGLAGSIVVAAKPRDDTAVKAAYEEQIKLFLKEREERLKAIEYQQRWNTYIQGRLDSMPGVSVSPPDPGARNVKPIVVFGPVDKEDAPTPPPPAPRSEPVKAPSFDALTKE